MKRSSEVTDEQVAAARLRVVLDAKLGRPTPERIRFLAGSYPDDDNAGLTRSTLNQVPPRGDIVIVSGPPGRGKSNLLVDLWRRLRGLRRIGTADEHAVQRILDRIEAHDGDAEAALRPPRDVVDRGGIPDPQEPGNPTAYLPYAHRWEGSSISAERQRRPDQ